MATMETLGRTDTLGRSNSPRMRDVKQSTHGSSEAQQHSEGYVARTIEEQTAKLPSDVFLWAAVASMGISLFLQSSGRRQDSLFIGQWAPAFLLMGLYNKVVKVAGSDRVHAS
ncbi:MAG: hypothetical protein WD872_17920 [Pirellulaceae bacterium]